MFGAFFEHWCDESTELIDAQPPVLAAASRRDICLMGFGLFLLYSVAGLAWWKLRRVNSASKKASAFLFSPAESQKWDSHGIVSVRLTGDHQLLVVRADAVLGVTPNIVTCLSSPGKGGLWNTTRVSS
jgi:hypothetical protein